MEGEEERWEDYEDINVSLTESLGHYAQTPSPSDVESLEFKFPSKGEGAFIAEEEDFGPDTEPEPPDYSENFCQPMSVSTKGKAKKKKVTFGFPAFPPVVNGGRDDHVINGRAPPTELTEYGTSLAGVFQPATKKSPSTPSRYNYLMSPEKEGNHETWRELLFKFTQETTFHGVRYITDQTPYILRRLIWLSLVLAATIVFSWFIVGRLMHLLDHPKSVDVEVIFNSSITFPAVTICNQNFFRQSAAHEYGLHDIIVRGYKKLEDPSQTVGDFEETVDAGFNLTLDSRLDGIENAYESFGDVTADVCKRICLKVISDSCCSLLYNRITKTCQITAMEPQMPGVKVTPENGIDYYQRKKCEVQTTAECDFEKNVCNFVVDFQKPLTWKLMKGRNKKARRGPAFDHTTMTAEGQFLHVSTKFRQSNVVAHLLSTYVLADNNTCIKFYHQIHGGTLIVRKGIQDDLSVVWERRSTKSIDWELAIARLPAGYFRIVIEASSETKSSGTQLVNIALDDVSIGVCEAINDCKESPLGLGYYGRVSTARSGRMCVPWHLIPTAQRPDVWSFGSLDIREEKSFCRNPDDDLLGPWCLTDHESAQMEYCDVPFCKCRSVEFMCTSGRCISMDQRCDDINDCGDLSDELDCEQAPSVNCTFNDNRNCSYVNSPESLAKWELAATASGEYMAAVPSGLRQGAIVSLLSPVINVTDAACLQFAFTVSGRETLDVLTQLEGSTFGSRYLCSVGADLRSDWHVVGINLPEGRYSLRFNAVLRDPRSAKVLLDNITVTFGNCSLETYEMTTMLTTEPFDFNTTVEETTAPLVTTTVGVDFTTPPVTTTAAGVSRIKKRSTGTVHPDTPPPIVTASTDAPTPNNSTGNWTRGWNATFLTTTPVVLTTEPYVYEPLCETTDGPCDSCYQPIRIKAKHNVSIRECFEEISIRCRFEDECACGYEYLRSNSEWQWRMDVDRPGASNMTTIEDLYSTDFHVTAVIDSEMEGEWIRLISPVMTITAPSCLAFMYYTRYMDIQVYRFSRTTTTEMIRITYDGQKRAWHHAEVDMPTGEWGVAFHVTYGRWAEDNVGIDNITLTEGECGQKADDIGVACRFDDIHMCGYTEDDEVQVMKSWFRSQESPSHDYYIRTRHPRVGDGKQTRRISSPRFAAHNTSCVQFRFFGQGQGREEIKTIALRDTGPPDQPTIWRVFGLIDNMWHSGQTLIGRGPHQLVFDINGEIYRGGLDNVKVTLGLCPPINCSAEEFRCTSVPACIPKMCRCDKLVNCAGGEDEFDCAAPEHEPVEPKGTDTIDDGKDKTVTDQSNGNRELGELLNLNGMYSFVGHLGRDFIYKCEWDGRNCSGVNFTKQVTDYGVCYTFNDDASLFLNTSKTGARFGLRLTLNIEQYEYMPGPNTDAGIKVFLHPQDELPQVRDLGFAISPGQHALIGIMRNDAVNLEEPWGDCKSANLDYYEDYRFSYCTMECELKRLNRTCNCRDEYMPHKDGLPPLCNVTQYFDCAVPSINTFMSEEEKICDCPKPCTQAVYEPSLSYATLSSISVDKILSADFDQLRTKFDNALETRQRVEGGTFIRDIEMFKRVSRGYVRMRRFAKEYLGEEDALFPRVVAAAQNMVGVFQNDLYTLLGDVQKLHQAFVFYYLDTRNLYEYFSIELKRSLTELDQLLYLTSRRHRVHEFLATVSKNALTQTTFLKETIEFFALKVKNTTFAADSYKEKSLSKWLPKRFTKDSQTCDVHLARIQRVLNDIRNLVNKIQRHASKGRVNNLHSTQGNFRSKMVDYKETQNEVEECLNEYTTVYESIRSALEGYNTSAHVTKHREILVYNYSSEIGVIRRDNAELDKAVKEYEHGAHMKKRDLLEIFIPSETPYEKANRITKFTGRVKSRISETLRQFIQETASQLKDFYIDVMVRAARLSPYLDENHFYEAASRMILWKLPKANLEVPDQMDDAGRELWKIWDRDTPIEGFVSSEARQHINIAIDGYYNVLLEEVDKFEEQLIETENALTRALEEVRVESIQYEKKRQINHVFILDNFLNMDVYFKQLKYQKVQQTKAYDTSQFLSDVGGFMGLLLGASVLTIFEVLDLAIYNGFRKSCGAGRKNLNKTPSEQTEPVVGTGNHTDKMKNYSGSSQQANTYA